MYVSSYLASVPNFLPPGLQIDQHTSICSSSGDEILLKLSFCAEILPINGSEQARSRVDQCSQRLFQPPLPDSRVINVLSSLHVPNGGVINVLIQHHHVPNAAHSGLWASRVASRLVRPGKKTWFCAVSELPAKTRSFFRGAELKTKKERFTLFSCLQLIISRFSEHRASDSEEYSQ